MKQPITHKFVKATLDPVSHHHKTQFSLTFDDLTNNHKQSFSVYSQPVLVQLPQTSLGQAWELSRQTTDLPPSFLACTSSIHRDVSQAPLPQTVSITNNWESA